VKNVCAVHLPYCVCVLLCGGAGSGDAELGVVLSPEVCAWRCRLGLTLNPAANKMAVSFLFCRIYMWLVCVCLGLMVKG